jgi:2-methylcitrate dehydratase PrpD
MNVTGPLCDKIAGIGDGDIGEAATAVARMLVLDGIAVAIAGARTEQAIRILADHLRAQEAKPVASALGLGFGLATVQAALLNGAAMHVLDFEPMWNPATHALSPTLPAILALAETKGASGRDIVTALVKGIEMQGWIRQASGHTEYAVHTFHPPGMVGPLGAAVAAGHLLRLDAGKLAHAIGIATSRAGGLISNIGTMTKSSHCGYAASLGLEAAMLAEGGFTANDAAFDAPQGYAAAFLPPTFDKTQLLRYGPPFRVVEPGCAIKMFPSQFSSHFVITAGLQAQRRISDAAGIQAVRLTAPVMPYVNRPQPKTGLEGKFSLQYALASALLDGAVRIATFSDAQLARPAMQALLPKIAVTMSPEIPTTFAGRYVLLEVDLADGSTIRERCDRPRGAWGGPPISASEHLVKVHDCLATFLAPRESDDLIALASRIDRLDAEGVRQLLRIASGRPEK